MKQGSYSGIENGAEKSNITKQTELLLMLKYNVSIDFLYSGEGLMFANRQAAVPVVNNVFSGVPYYESQEAFCSIVATYDDMEVTPTYFIDFKPFNDCTAYITACGDSMYPMYCAGDIIAVKELHNMDTLLWGGLIWL